MDKKKTELLSTERLGMKSVSSKILADALKASDGKPIFIMDPKGELKDLCILETMELAQKVKAGEMTIETALIKAHNNGVRRLEKACLEKSRKMCTISPDHTYHRATGTRMITKCAEHIINESW